MDIVKKSRLKKKKTINNLPIGVFNRLQFVTAFKEDSMQSPAMESIFESYTPRVLNSCSISCRIPDDPLDVDAFQRIINVPGSKPYLQLPELPKSLPPISKKNKIYAQAKYPSLVPVLITAKFCGIDKKSYHVVTMRNSLKKLAMNDEDFIVNAVRFGSTLFLRRFPHYRTTNKNDVGFRFEELCTDKCNSNFDYGELIDGQIGNYKILMMGETDAVNKLNGESVELKCKKSKASKRDEHDWWLQAYLSGTKTIIHGRRGTGDDTVISEFKEYATSALSDQRQKSQMFNRLHAVLQFLFSNVAAGKSYMLRGHKHETTKQRCMRLYEIVNENDKKNLTFVTDKLLQQLSVEN